MRQPPLPEDFRSALHGPRVTARLGVWLGAAFGICFLTGLVSHLQQHPLPFFVLPPDPSWAYRVTQGIHVATGTASVPLLLAKMYAAYPRLFERPLLGRPVRALERGSIAVLVASAFLQVFTGIANGAGWYVFGFGFTQVHFAFAWVAIGALVIHIAVKLPVIRTALSAPLEAPDDAAATNDAATNDAAGSVRVGADTADSVRVGGDRRWFIRGALGVSAGALALTVGSTVRPLESLSLLRTRRPSTSPGGVPVNRTALQAGIGPSTDEGNWRVALSGPGGTRSLGLAELLAMPQVTADLPISCVEGWSAGATWSGVRMRDLLALVGGSGADVRVDSAERSGGYRQTVLPAAYAAHPDTLVALQMNGARLSVDHGFPARLIAPNRAGVLQTKWLERLEVIA